MTASTTRDDLLRAAAAPDTTPFDYVIVGSGAGGGPLAARLALNGCRVLVVEAGVDPARDEATAADDANALRDIYAVPAFHAAASEDPETCWAFSVRHYADTTRQARDSKYDAAQDPCRASAGAQAGGIQYPRAAAIGGCTAHHAMIVIRPNDADWDRIAALTNDPSWRADVMQGYFGKIERCLYYSVYRGFAARVLGIAYTAARFVVRQCSPRRQLDPNGHGFDGWQTTSFVDPLVITSIFRRDKTFVRVLLGVCRAMLSRRRERSKALRALLGFQLLQFLDPNVPAPAAPKPERLSLMSIGTDGRYRRGLREHLHDVMRRFPDRLVFLNPAHALRLVFAPGEAAPRAVGVEVVEGPHWYRASARAGERDRDKDKAGQGAGGPSRREVYARKEVIVCGGAFNTPQLLMLSGIGDRDHLAAHDIPGPRDSAGRPVAGIVHLPGVGRNLQDRYEVSVITEATQPFTTLDGATFAPGQPPDPILLQWRKDGTGLYSTNGGAIGMFFSSSRRADGRTDPDLFVFGVPVAFRGYYWGWSRDLLRTRRGDATEQRNLWSWLILKAYTRNRHGSVRLRGTDPFEPPQIDFHSFADIETGGAQADPDLEALGECVDIVRRINAHVSVFSREVQPGPERPSGSQVLRDWIMDEAWGHHPCGTCAMGADAWRADPATLRDPLAVLDSRLRVHGVEGLRVVDASVFPEIPGYYIATPTFMVGEKAADVLLADDEGYPRRLEQGEAKAIRLRRRLAGLPQGKGGVADVAKGAVVTDAADVAKGAAVADDAGVAKGAALGDAADVTKGAAVADAADAAKNAPIENDTRLPPDTIALALSGGGIRSATFCLGFLQAFAMRGRLRDVDLISSVSGGGYVAAFVGRLFLRQPGDPGNKASRVEAILSDPTSPEIGWLRRNAQYLVGGGRSDAWFDLALVLRNLVSMHLWIGVLLFGAFGLARWLALACPGPLAAACGRRSPWLPDLVLSAWWWLPALALVVGVLPPAIAYWLNLRDHPGRGEARWMPFLVWLALVACAIAGLAIPGVVPWSALALGVLLLAWAEQEVVRWRMPGVNEKARRWNEDAVVRNRLTHLLSTALFGFVASALWVVVDSAAQLAAQHAFRIRWSMAALILLPLLRWVAEQVLKRRPREPVPVGMGMRLALAALAFLLAFVLLLFVDTLAHLAFTGDRRVALWLTGSALLVSACVGQARVFLNLSSLQQAFSQKLVRTFLGASNDARVHPTGTDLPVPVDVSHLDDDIDFDDYHPEAAGGPLHLVGVCVNNTVDPLTGAPWRDDKGMPMCAGPVGVSVGRRFHALWEARDKSTPGRRTRVTPLRLQPDPHQFHVLGRSDGKPVLVERMRLGQWMAISGAAFTTGSGRTTRLAQSLLLGLLNVRLGYWWNSGIGAGHRPSRYPPSLWQRLKSLPSTLFRVQASLLDEWRAYFSGPAARLWYLSDGGHFDNTGLYELIRRRAPMMIAVDATHDPAYLFDDLALVTRQVRLDFRATIDWLAPGQVRELFESAQGQGTTATGLPAWFAAHLNPHAIGAFTDLRRRGPRGAALARVTYADTPDRVSWLLLVKPSLPPDPPTDLRAYAAMNAAFPNQTTLDQFYDDNQWEAYRMLGRGAGLDLLADAGQQSPPPRSPEAPAPW